MAWAKGECQANRVGEYCMTREGGGQWRKEGESHIIVGAGDREKKRKKIETKIGWLVDEENSRLRQTASDKVRHIA